MVRADLIVGFIDLALLIFCLIDVITIFPSRVRALPKVAWVFVIVLLPIVGPLLWLVIGKERGGPEQTARRASTSRAPKGPDDDPDFLRNAVKLQDQEARIRELEAELKALNDDKPEE